MQNDSILKLEGLTMTFGGLTAVKDLSINVPKGSIVGLIGPNGAGKTTVFNVITGFYEPTAGRVLFKGMDISGKSPHEICSLGIARTFQNIRLFGNETVLQNVMVACNVRVPVRWWEPPLSLPLTRSKERTIRSKAMDLLKKVGLEHLADEIATSLPYGQQRRLEIARALATDPELLLLDEPAAGMNPKETHALMDFIRAIRDLFGLTIMLIEHDMRVVMGICEHIWVLDYGLLIAEGPPSFIQSNKRVIEAYLGEEYARYVDN
ncbi:MAG TPA: ABC transporter ATP-binding protein [Acetomicrobium flavidum]|uniref:Amino acid/amide ABC transporter ATP-binding protein 1, HAAT family n=1 Tax=Acetomicrobium flavidum TaxID=49896 RepID=A0ABY1JCC2_9BACT|nr:amino acid/amide ABC transporter ATP-binding protein 1, HAAT family [Acetomicrobium flavidum]HPP13661.1 ABC transporter ATP-binding protein [Acetomicrobium flavidum]